MGVGCRIVSAAFTVIGGAPRQYLAGVPDTPLRMVDLSGEPDPGAAAHAAMRADLGRPMDLLDAPLFAHTLFVLGGGHFLWYQRLHHLVVDGYGLSQFTEAVARVYDALVCGRVPASGLEPVSALMDADRAYRDSALRDRDRAFWSVHLADLPEPPGAGGRRQSRLPDEIARHARQVDAGTTAALRAAASGVRTGLGGLAIAAAGLYE